MAAWQSAAQARAVEARVDELADARQAHRAAEVPAHHGEAGGAAIHLVDLPDVREAPDAALALDEASGLGERLPRDASVRLRPRRAGPDRPSSWTARLGRQDLVREVGRHRAMRL